MFEHNFGGTILLGLPVIFALVMLSKGSPAGAISLGVAWLASTVYFSVPSLWPQEKQLPRQQRKRGAPQSPQLVQTWLTIALVIWGVGGAVVVHSLDGRGASGPYLGLLVATVLCLYFFVHLAKRKIIESPEVPARVVLAIVILGVAALSSHAYLLIRASVGKSFRTVRSPPAMRVCWCWIYRFPCCPRI